MPTPDATAPELLRREILDEARRQEKDILRRARQAAEAAVAKAEKEAQEFRGERMRAAEVEATRRIEAILATVPVEAGRLRSARIEELLQAVHDRVRERLRARSGFDFREVMAGLSAEALRQMAGDAFRLRISTADHRVVGGAFVEEIRKRSGRTSLQMQLVADSTLKDGDVRLEDDAGRQVWNLGLEARLERCWPELRRQIAAQTGIVDQGSA